MGAERTKGKPKPRPEATETNDDLPKLVQEQATDDVVESFSQGFEEDLRRILGDKYRERPKRGA